MSSSREKVQQTLALDVGVHCVQKNSPHTLHTFNVLKGYTVWHLSQKSMSIVESTDALLLELSVI